MDFVKNAKVLSKAVCDEYIIFQSKIDELTKHIQTKYPEVIAEYMPTDCGIVFIGLEDTQVKGREFYGIDDLVKWLGRRFDNEVKK